MRISMSPFIMSSYVEFLVVQSSPDSLVGWGLGCSSRRSRGAHSIHSREVVGCMGIEWGTEKSVCNGYGVRDRGIADVYWEEIDLVPGY